MARWKARGRLYIIVSEPFSCYLLRLGRYEQKSVEVGVFRRGVGHFERRFQREGGIAHQPVSCQKTRVIAVSCGIKISAVHHLVLSQYTHLTHGQTHRRTDMERQNYDSNTVRCIICSRMAKTEPAQIISTVTTAETSPQAAKLERGYWYMCISNLNTVLDYSIL